MKLTCILPINVVSKPKILIQEIVFRQNSYTLHVFVTTNYNGCDYNLTTSNSAKSFNETQYVSSSTSSLQWQKVI